MRFRPAGLLALVTFLLVFQVSPLAAQSRGRGDRTDDARPEASRVPRLVKFAGRVGQTSRPVQPTDAEAVNASATVPVTFAIYAEQNGGGALWQETQNVALDAEGRYSVLLGAASRDGMPAELFATGEPRWLGVRVNVAGAADGSGEQARVLLVSVPYALRAADAETLGGRAATDFVLREELAGWSGVASGVMPGAADAPRAVGGTQGVVNATGAVNFLPRVTAINSPAPGDVTYADSQIFDDGTNIRIGNPAVGTGLVNIELTTPLARNAFTSTLRLENTSAITGTVISAMSLTGADRATANHESFQVARFTLLKNVISTGLSTNFDAIFATTSFINQNAPYPIVGWRAEYPRVAVGMTLETYYGLFLEGPLGGAAGTITNKFAMVTAPGSGNVGIGTTAPIDLLEVSGGNIRLTGLGNAIIFPDGSVLSAAASGIGGGTITGVTAGAGLSGGGAAGGVTLSANFAGTGTASTIARSDHDHNATYLPLTGGTLTGALVVPNFFQVSGAGVLANFSNNVDQDVQVNISAIGDVDKRALITTTTPTNLAFGVGNVELMRLNSAGNLTLAGAINGGFRVQATAGTPNILGGFSGNLITSGLVGATIAGGGDGICGFAAVPFNLVTDDFGFIGGGCGNRAGNNTGSTSDSPYATVGGGFSNSASGLTATVGGGDGNTASGIAATVGGGAGNTASGLGATVPGGLFSEAVGDSSFAAGRRAKADHAGAFVWADSTNADMASLAVNEFVVRASGGVRFRNASGNVFTISGAGNAVASGSLTSSSLTVSGTATAGLGGFRVGTGNQGGTLLGFPVLGGDVQMRSNVDSAGAIVDNFRPTWALRVSGGADDVSFHRGPAGGPALAAQLMTLTGSGNLGIGTAAPSDRVHVNGELRVNSCVKNSGGGSIAGTCSSDLRLKKNIRAFLPLLGQFAQLQPVSFEWRAAEHPEYHFGPQTNTGLIAQEVQKLFPALVSPDDRGFLRVSYTDLQMVMVQAIKDLAAENEAQREENQRLGRELEDLRATVRALAEQMQTGSGIQDSKFKIHEKSKE